MLIAVDLGDQVLHIDFIKNGWTEIVGDFLSVPADFRSNDSVGHWEIKNG